MVLSLSDYRPCRANIFRTADLPRWEPSMDFDQPRSFGASRFLNPLPRETPGIVAAPPRSREHAD
jgi:hypothetical protein